MNGSNAASSCSSIADPNAPDSWEVFNTDFKVETVALGQFWCHEKLATRSSDSKMFLYSLLINDTSLVTSMRYEA